MRYAAIVQHLWRRAAGFRVKANCPSALKADHWERALANRTRSKAMDIDAVRAAYVSGVSMKSWIKPQDIPATDQLQVPPKSGKISDQTPAIDRFTGTLAR